MNIFFERISLASYEHVITYALFSILTEKSYSFQLKRFDYFKKHHINSLVLHPPLPSLSLYLFTSPSPPVHQLVLPYPPFPPLPFVLFLSYQQQKKNQSFFSLYIVSPPFILLLHSQSQPPFFSLSSSLLFERLVFLFSFCVPLVKVYCFTYINYLR